jgi:hypothetical protein
VGAVAGHGLVVTHPLLWGTSGAERVLGGARGKQTCFNPIAVICAPPRRSGARTAVPPRSLHACYVGATPQRVRCADGALQALPVTLPEARALLLATTTKLGPDVTHSRNSPFSPAQYEEGSAPALAINATIEKTKTRFANYGAQGLLCGADGLPHLIVDGSLDHLGEFTYPGLGFLYVAGWIGYAGRSYVIANKAKDKPLDGEIIIDVPAALNIMFASAGWPLLAVRELQKGTLLEDDGTFLWGQPWCPCSSLCRLALTRLPRSSLQPTSPSAPGKRRELLRAAHGSARSFRSGTHWLST